MPEWRDFFEKVSARVADETNSRVSAMQRLVDTQGGKLQKTVVREENFPPYDHDVVATIIVQGTDIATAAERKALLTQRTDERCHQYLLAGQKQKKIGKRKTKIDDHRELDETCPLRNRNSHRDEEAKAMANKLDDDGVSDFSDSDIVLSQQKFLEDITHNNSNDEAVNKCIHVVAEDLHGWKGTLVVVYHSTFNADAQSWEMGGSG